MMGFALGTVCMVLLVKTLRHGRPCGHGGHHDRWHDGGWGAGRWRGGRWGGGRAPWWMRGAFARLRTSPDQELELVEAARTLRDEGLQLREAVLASRVELVAALRAPEVDETLLAELFARHDEALATARKGFVGAFAQVHQTLDDEQRTRLASWLERRAGRPCASPAAGPYRSAAS